MSKSINQQIKEILIGFDFFPHHRNGRGYVKKQRETAFTLADLIKHQDCPFSYNDIKAFKCGHINDEKAGQDIPQLYMQYISSAKKEEIRAWLESE